MRTTLTLDSDVAELIQQATRNTGATFKSVVNTTLRRGFRAQDLLSAASAFVLTPLPGGILPGIDPVRTATIPTSPGSLACVGSIPSADAHSTCEPNGR